MRSAQRVLATFALATLVVTPGIGQKRTLSPQDIYKAASKSVVTITTPSKTGTGFFDASGNLFTAYHVVKGAPWALVKFSDSKEVYAQWYSAIDPANDIAILMTPEYSGWQSRETGPPLGDWDATQVGAKVFVIGSPLGLSGTLTEGIVSAKRKTEGGDVLQLSASITSGSSGSPILNDSGEVIGMATSGIRTAQGLNFGASVKDLKAATGVPMEFVSASPSLTWTKSAATAWTAKCYALFMEVGDFLRETGFERWSGSSADAELVSGAKELFSLRFMELVEQLRTLDRLKSDHTNTGMLLRITFTLQDAAAYTNEISNFPSMYSWNHGITTRKASDAIDLSIKATQLVSVAERTLREAIPE